VRRPAALAVVGENPALRRSVEDGRPVFWTRGLADPPDVYGERVVFRETAPMRRWDPMRSKLAAALTRGYDGPLPRPAEFWAYLGAASGTTASHVADLVGPTGAVFAVEKSLRPFRRLVRLAERYPNLLPVLADARSPATYASQVPLVDGLYVDIAQPDQVEIALENARWLAAREACLILALKTPSMGRDAPARTHLERARRQLEAAGEVDRAIGLEPFHRGHFLLATRLTRRFLEGGHRPATRPVARLVG
jgi:fibrillarin-like rRNA methylase